MLVMKRTDANDPLINFRTPLDKKLLADALARMLAANRITEAEYDELRREALAALNRLAQERNAPARREDVNLLRDLLDEWGGVSLGFMIESKAVDPEIANRVMRLKKPFSK